MGKTSSLLGTALAFLVAVPTLAAEGDAAALASKLKEAKVSLQQGLATSAKYGKPISGKFEVEDGKLQLSVYTAKGDGFSEVIVDHKTGKVVKAEPITSGDDLTAAKAQNEAMANAKTSLSAAVSRTVKENQGYRAVSATPAMKDGHPTAEIKLLKGTESKTASEALD
jgi:hypothetical protein